MTLTHDSRPPATPGLGRSELEVVDLQLRAIDSFHATQRAAQQAAEAAARSRELRMDNDRALEILRREHEALVARAHEQLRLSGELLGVVASRRVILAHRNEWFRGKVAQLLRDQGWEVVAALDNGADTVGLAVAEQPDVVLVEDKLAMLPGEQVVREIRHFCPRTLVVAQVDYSDRVATLLDAGATTVWTRQVPPQDVARGLVQLLAA